MAKKNAPSALAEELLRARALAAEMNAATDGLNEALAEAEKALADLKLGVTAFVLMESQSDSPWYSGLRFGKEKQTWRLLYESGLEDDDPDLTPLVNTSRATRLEAVELLPKLVQELIATATREVEEVKAKTKAVQDLTESIKLSEILS